MEVTIVPVQGRGAIKQFVEFPWFIYREYSPMNAWVPPLRRHMTFTLDASRHPFWQHAERELFLAYRQGVVVGRIAAIVDRSYNELWDERTGTFGFFECIDDQGVADALLDASKDWLRSRGMRAVRGPLSPSMNYEVGCLVEGFSKSPMIMMAYNPPYYRMLMEGAGFAKAKDLLAFHKTISTGIPERLRRLAGAMKRKPDVLIRQMNLGDLPREMMIIRDLFNSSWRENWGFSPMTNEEMTFMGKELRPIAVPELALLAFVNGEAAGVVIGLPDYNQVLVHLDGKLGPIQLAKALILRRRISSSRAMLFGFKPQFRRTGLPILLYWEAEQAARRLRYESYELSWNLEDNDPINRFDEAIGAKLYKRYRVFQREL